MTVICVGMGETTSTAIVEWRYWNDGTRKWRAGMRNGQFVRDYTLTGLGWDGVENTDWKNEYAEGPTY